MKRFACALGVLMLGGCALLPRDWKWAQGANTQPSAATSCAAIEPRVAYAVTTPPSRDDFPVVYRVTVPHDPEARVWPVDQGEVSAGCPRAGCC